MKVPRIWRRPHNLPCIYRMSEPKVASMVPKVLNGSPRRPIKKRELKTLFNHPGSHSFSMTNIQVYSLFRWQVEASYEPFCLHFWRIQSWRHAKMGLVHSCSWELWRDENKEKREKVERESWRHCCVSVCGFWRSSWWHL